MTVRGLSFFRGSQIMQVEIWHRRIELKGLLLWSVTHTSTGCAQKQEAPIEQIGYRESPARLLSRSESVSQPWHKLSKMETP